VLTTDNEPLYFASPEVRRALRFTLHLGAVEFIISRFHNRRV